MLVVSAMAAALLSVTPHLLEADLGLDSSTGHLKPEETLFSFSFDQRSEGNASIVAYWSSGNPYDADSYEELQIQDSERAIEGEGFLSFPTASDMVFLEFPPGEPLNAKMANRQIEVTVWTRSVGMTVQFGLVWPDTVYGFKPSKLGFVQHWAFEPTGRESSDGWREWTSGPIDAEVGAARVRGVAIIEDSENGSATPKFEKAVWIDALRVRDVGPRKVPNARCRLKNQEQTCGAQGACMFGRCVPGSFVYGNIPASQAHRKDLIDRRIYEMRRFAASRHTQTVLDANFIQPLRALDRPDVGAREFHSTLRKAYNNLADGHAAAENRHLFTGNGGLCLELGRADLLPAPYRNQLLPMFFKSAAIAPFDQLQVGDVLIAVDDEPVATFRERAAPWFYFGGDPRARELVTTPELIQGAIFGGSKLRFMRCHQAGGCTDANAQIIEIDLRDWLIDAYGTANTELIRSWVVCDHRFVDAVPARDSSDQDWAGVREAGGIRYLQINAVPNKKKWNQTVDLALTQLPGRLLLDQRTGHGGAFESVMRILNPLMPAGRSFIFEEYPNLEVPLDAALQANLAGCMDPNRCGGVFKYALSGSGSSVSPGLRVAVLNASDVSGNDFVSLGLSQVGGEVRIYGGAPSWGAFGWILTLPRLTKSSHYGATLQASDTVWGRTTTEDPLIFRTGVGVSPTHVLYQRQSDLLRNVDTLLAAAEAWLRGGN